MTVRRRNGVWYCDVHFQGERYRRRSPGNNKRDAEKYERVLMQRLRMGLSIDGNLSERLPTSQRTFSESEPTTNKEVPTFAAFADEFMETYAKANNKPSEQVEKRCHLNSQLIPAFGPLPIDEIGTRQIERLKASLLQGKRSRKRVTNILATLGRILTYAVEIEVLDKAPKIKKLKADDRTFQFLDFGPYEDLIAAAADEPMWQAAILLGGDAGLRLGEIRGFRPEHWDHGHQRITVQRSLWRDMETTTKGWNRRTIPLTARAQTALERLAPCDRTYLIACDREKPLTLEMTRWHLPRMCRRANIQPIGWHALRHTFCSHLAMMGAPPRTIQELAGHADLATTLKYMHLVEGEKDRAIDLLNRRKTRLDESHSYPTNESGEEFVDDPSTDPKPSQTGAKNRPRDDSET